MKEKSCLTNLLVYSGDVTSRLNKAEPEDMGLDFQKASTKVPHKSLLHKIGAHGVEDNKLAWREDSLTSRKQRVRING